MRALFLLKYEGARLANRTFNDREISDFLSLGQQELIKQRFAPFRNSKGIGYNGRPDVPQSKEVRDAELIGLLAISPKIKHTQMILGTATNGGLRDTDGDVQPTGTGNYGVFCPQPNDAMYILAEYADTCENYPTLAADETTATGVRYNIDVINVNYNEYRKGIRDYYARPFKNLVWSVNYGAYTPGIFSEGLIGEAEKKYSTEGGVNYNMSGSNLPTGINGIDTVKLNTDRSIVLLPGKDRKVLNYQCTYLKRPKNIEVDVVNPATQVNSELPDFLHEEIVDYAVKLASASIVPEQGKYQVNQLESKEDE